VDLSHSAVDQLALAFRDASRWLVLCGPEVVSGDDREGVDAGVHGLDPLQAGLDDFQVLTPALA